MVRAFSSVNRASPESVLLVSSAPPNLVVTIKLRFSTALVITDAPINTCGAPR
jgi:hypothetical protein